MEFTLGLFLAGLGFGAAGMLGLERFAESDFVQTGFPKLVPWFGGYESEHFAGVVTATLALPMAAQLLYTASWKSNAAFCSPWPHLGLSAVGIWTAERMYNKWKADNLLECGLALCAFWGSTERNRDSANGYFQLISVPAFLLAVGFSLAHLSFAMRNLRQQRSAMFHPMLLLPPDVALKRTPAFAWDWATVGVVFLVAFFTSILLPNSWLNWTARKIRINAIEIVDQQSAFRDFKFGLVTRPEVPGAVFRTVQVQLGSRVIGKIFPDVYLFYGWLLACLLVLAVDRRRYCYFRGAQYWVRLGAFTALSLAGLACYVHAWWFHNWHGWFGGVTELVFKEPSWFEKLARTLGQVCLLLLGVLLLPVSRNSSLLRLTQVPHEQALVWHRGFANAFLLAVLAHVGCWWKVFCEQHVFPHDALSGALGLTPMYFPLNFHAKPGKCATLSCLDPEYNQPAADNFTIPLINFVCLFVALPSFGLLTLRRVRRERFEWFYYAHTVAGPVLVLAVAWHAACVLVFLLPALMFMGVDLTWRFVQASQADRTIIQSKRGSGLTSLEIQRLGLAIIPGQYVMLQIPALSQFEFHPFSVSALGPESFWVHVHCTGAANSFSRELERQNELEGQVVHLQGALGVPPMFTGRAGVMFIAGGIGITPIACIVQALMEEGTMPLVVVWTVKRCAMFVRFSEWIAQCRQRANVQLLLFCTGSDSHGDDEDEGELDVWQASRTRPDLVQLFAQLLLLPPFEPQTSPILVYACGPPALVLAAQHCSSALASEFYTEVFES